MVEFAKIVDARAQVEKKPDYDDGCKRARNLGCAKRLDCKQQDENSA